MWRSGHELKLDREKSTHTWLQGEQVHTTPHVSPTCYYSYFPAPLIGRQVQRTAEPVEEVSEGATGWGPPGGRHPDAPEKDSGDYEEEGGDGKAMKLTLMEEVLLLGLKDREVSACP